MNGFDVILDDNFSFHDEGIYAIERPNIPVTVPSYRTEKVEKRDGDLTFFTGFKDRDIEIKFNFIDTENVTLRIRKILPKILFAKKIRFTDDIDIFYKIKKVKLDPPERSYRWVCDFSLIVTLEPFAYIESEDIVLTENTTITNFGYDSEPIIRVYGTGNLSFTITGQNVTVNNVDEYVDIDTNAMRCYKETTNMLPNMVNDFQILKNGENDIHLGTNVTKLVITPNFRYL